MNTFDPTTDEVPPLASLMTKWNYFEEARAFVEEFPEYGSTEDLFGTSALDLIDSYDRGRSAWPLELQAQGYDPAAALRPPNQMAPSYGNGGWLETELSFPGWDSETCDIVELSGEAVSSDPEHFLREFVLKHERPVILRDFIEHDVDGLAPLVDRMAKDEVLSSVGGTLWEIGVIPYESSYTGMKIPKRTLSDYVKRNMEGNSQHAPGEPPKYIFSSSAVKEGVSDLFPELPKWAQDGIPGVAHIKIENAQVKNGLPYSLVQIRLSRSYGVSSLQLLRAFHFNSFYLLDALLLG